MRGYKKERPCNCYAVDLNKRRSPATTRLTKTSFFTVFSVQGIHQNKGSHKVFQSEHNCFFQLS